MPYTEQQVKAILQVAYNRLSWKAFLETDLGWPLDYYAAPLDLEIADENVKHAFELGNFTLADATQVAVVEIRLKGYKIQRNRVGLNDIARRAYKVSGQAELLVVFYDQERPEWRFSFMSREGELGSERTDPKRYTYIFGTVETHRTAIDRFRSLALLGRRAMLTNLKDAFSVEKLNDEFFAGYKNHYKGLIAHLAINCWAKFVNTPKPTDDAELIVAEKPIRDFAKRLMGRLVFLQFLQKKGWMGCTATPNPTATWADGKPNFLQHLYLAAPDKSRFYQDTLTKLFFETLNKRRPADAFVVPGIDTCRVPYLNGGLFDQDEADHLDLPIEGRLLEDVLNFFARYNFTIEENRQDDHEVGIDPEMLGHIFENLLEDNRERGTFYTPKVIVQYMCQEALVHYLIGHGLANDLVAPFVRGGLPTEGMRPEAVRIDMLLRDIKICDPAIGSGAFPMGMLTEIFACRQRLYPLMPNAASRTFDPVVVKKSIIQQSVYGVDIDPAAVDIARLRFWLSLVVDEDKPEPLPNLDYKIMQGNSLLESFEGIRLDHLVPNHIPKVIIDPTQQNLFQPVGAQTTMFATKPTVNATTQLEINEVIASYFAETDPTTKKQKRDRISILVQKHLAYNLDFELSQATRFFNEAQLVFDKQPVANPNDPVGKQMRHNKVRQQAVNEVLLAKNELDRIASANTRLEALAKTDERPYFLWHLFFKDVFEGRGGFDVVIANPPYFSLGGRPAEQVAYEAEEYRTYEKSTDIYCLFYELALKKLRAGGVFSFITSNSWLQTKYGRSLRNLLAHEAQPLALLNFEDTLLFKEATVETNILIARKATPEVVDHAESGSTPVHNLMACTIPPTYKADVPLAAYVTTNGYTLDALPEDGWAVLSTEGHVLKTKMEAAGLRLKDWDVKINYGIKTGLNEAFIIDETTRQRLIAEDPRSAEIIKPTLRGRDLQRYSYRVSGEYMIATHNGYTCADGKKVPKIDAEKDYPAVFKYLKQYENSKSPKVIGKKDGTFQTLRGRSDQGDHWSNLRSCAFQMDFEKPKIIWGHISDKAKFVFDEEKHYPNNKCFILTGNNYSYLLGIFNAKIIEWVFETMTVGTGMGTTQWDAYKVELLPIPPHNPTTAAPLESLVQQVLDNKANGLPTLIQELKIDQLVYELYGLSEDEILLVERWWATKYPKLAKAHLAALVGEPAWSAYGERYWGG